MSTTFALSRPTTGEGVPSAEGVARSCDIITENPKTKLRHASRELRQKFTPNKENQEQIKATRKQLENLLKTPINQKPKTNQNRIS